MHLTPKPTLFLNALFDWSSSAMLGSRLPTWTLSTPLYALHKLLLVYVWLSMHFLLRHPPRTQLPQGKVQKMMLASGLKYLSV
jgi:hypothetical protein